MPRAFERLDFPNDGRQICRLPRPLSIAAHLAGWARSWVGRRCERAHQSPTTASGRGTRVCRRCCLDRSTEASLCNLRNELAQQSECLVRIVLDHAVPASGEALDPDKMAWERCGDRLAEGKWS